MAYSITIDVSAILDGQNIDAADVLTPLANTKTAIQDLGNGVSAPEQFRLVEIATPSNPAAGSDKIYTKSDGVLYRLTSAGVETPVGPLTTLPQICNTRLTLTTGVPITTSDVTAATSIYVTPYLGNRISLYDGSSAWNTYTFSEITISLASQTADKNYDVFCYLSSGSVIAETVVWTNDTTRATALVLQNGVYVKTGTTTKRYVGTYRTTSTIGQCEDSLTKRYVWNYYNRVARDLYLTESTDSWTYATATVRPWNNSTGNRFSFVRGVSEDFINVRFTCIASQAGGVIAHTGLGLDSTTVFSGLSGILGSTTIGNMTPEYIGKPSEGFHYIQALERASGATVTFYGDNGGIIIQSGMSGQIAS